MEKRRSTYSLTKKFYYLPLILLVIISFGPACKKSKQSDPCEGILSERMPTQVGLIFVDGQTGENILLSKNVDTATITITPEPANALSEQGVIIKQPGAPMHGALVFLIADTKKGTFKYKIDIPDVGSTTLSYINNEVSSGNPCNPYYINITDPVIEDHEFTLSRTNSRLLFKITL